MDGLWIIFFTLFVTQNMGYRIQEEDDVQNVIALYGEKVRIVCQDDLPLQQCVFLQPNGTRIMFSGLQYGTPECFVDTVVTQEATGSWLCQLMPQDSTRIIKKSINVRIGGRLAPVKDTVVAQSGDDVTLICITTEGRIPLDDCYFNSPTSGEIISVNRRMPNLTGRYSYPINKSLDRGDCAVTIHNVSALDSGLWQCSGRLEHEYIEEKAAILLHVGDVETYLSNRNTTMYTYIAAISILVLMTLVTVTVAWKKLRNIRYLHTTLIEVPSTKTRGWEINGRDGFNFVCECRGDKYNGFT